MPISFALQSRLPQVGTTIFTVMSALAAEHAAVNLGQGFPDFDCDSKLVDAVTQAMQSGQNQYPPMTGVAQLRHAVSDKIQKLYTKLYDPADEITITAGATQAIMTAILAIAQPADEVIVLTPSYDSYAPSIQLAGATPVFVPLKAGSFAPDFVALRRAITPKTRALLINSPHNPSGSVWSMSDLLQLQTLLDGTRIILISDEVYEHMVFDGVQHPSVSRLAGLAERSFVVSSFGKTFHVTGWKVGYVAAPAELTAEFRKVHQFNVFTVNTPMQHALAAYMQNPQPYLDLPSFYQTKRDFFRAGLAQTPFELLPCQGSYFQCVSYANVPVLKGLTEHQAAEWLTRELKVAAIPVAAFYPDNYNQQLLRFCFAKQPATLELALERLARLA